MAGEELRKRVDRTLEAIGLTDRANDRVENFSGGMKRRLNLGAALIHQPKLLLLDEPTTGVDPQSRNHIFEEVRRLAAEGVGIVYTSHYIEEVQSLCSRVGIIDHGKLIACDSLPVLLAQMGGVIRFRVPDETPSLREPLQKIPGVEINGHDGPFVEMECRDVKTALMRLIALLNERQIELISLETTEPNLERVFLHLTGLRLSRLIPHAHLDPGQERLATVAARPTGNGRAAGNAVDLYPGVGRVAGRRIRPKARRPVASVHRRSGSRLH